MIPYYLKNHMLTLKRKKTLLSVYLLLPQETQIWKYTFTEIL